MTGIQMTEIKTKKSTKIRPTITFSFSEGFFLNIVHTSTVKIVDAELNMDVKEDIKAANMTPNMAPRKPYRKIMHSLDAN